MKNPLYAVSIDEFLFDDRIIAIMLRTYLSRQSDALEILTPIIRASVAVRFYTPPSVADLAAIPLNTVLDGEKLAELIDEAVEYIRAEKVTSPDPEINNIFTAAEEVLDSIDGSAVVAEMTVHLAEYITKCYYYIRPLAKFKIYSLETLNFRFFPKCKILFRKRSIEIN